MRDWRPRLERWVRVWGRLGELTQDCFPVRPPAGGLPTALPSCPALADFYARCDGGTFGPYTFDPGVEVADPAADEWLAGSPGLGSEPGQFVRVGDHEFGHALLWDAATDEVVLYSPDDEAVRRLGRTMDQFLGRLFHPSAKSSTEATQLWAEALAEADGHAEPGPVADGGGR